MFSLFKKTPTPPANEQVQFGKAKQFVAVSLDARGKIDKQVDQLLSEFESSEASLNKIHDALFGQTDSGGSLQDNLERLLTKAGELKKKLYQNTEQSNLDRKRLATREFCGDVLRRCRLGGLNYDGYYHLDRTVFVDHGLSKDFSIVGYGLPERNSGSVMPFFVVNGRYLSIGKYFPDDLDGCAKAIQDIANRSNLINRPPTVIKGAD